MCRNSFFIIANPIIPNHSSRHRLSASTATKDPSIIHTQQAGIRILTMDKKDSGKKASEDATRESLIAISYGAPDLTAKMSPKSKAEENVVDPHRHDEDEIYRSKLMSISSSTSSNVKAQPVQPGQPHP
ncbi:uncharacterized protein LOC121775832 isoform X2 [Salvia splendens]|uniref:uncharacterized protein LOC121775832 isoform X2 n=1 Tax=Salvia splendens TaxID=180675 RepID=UPI001C278F4C|nr:uncharacterized protein LOC121775832 isoform X2 [Salvia splendens]